MSRSHEAAAVDDEATRQKRRELESAIAARARTLREEEARLRSLEKQIQSLDVTEQRSIEQLKLEIMRVSGELARATTSLHAAESRLEAATEELRERQEEKRALSESLMSILLESEDAAAVHLQAVEAGLKGLGTHEGERTISDS